MDDILISLTIGRTSLLILGMLFLFAVGAGVVMVLLMRRRMMKGMTHGGGCPCMAMLRGEGHPRD